MVSAFADTTFTFGTDPAFNFEMILRWTGINARPMEDEDTKHHNVNNTATRNIHGDKIRCFPATYLEALSTSISSFEPSMKKNISPPPKTLEDDMTQTVNKCVKLKFKTTVKMFCSFKIYLSVSTTAYYLHVQGQWPLNTTADCGGFPYWFSVTYWLAEWRCSMASLVLNWFIQMEYLLAQIKIIIISFSLTK